MTERLVLPDHLRADLKEPFGPIYTDTTALLADAARPLITVGDVVTYHVIEAGETPAVALVDEQTERSVVDEEIARTIASHDFDQTVTVENPAATLTADLLGELRRAIDTADSQTTLLVVDGEEDLAALPAIVFVPRGGTVVYGQPGSGMVRVPIDDETKAVARELLSQMSGDTALYRSELEGE